MKFKDDIVASRFKDMNVTAQKIATEMAEWLQKNHGIALMLTTAVSNKEEDKKLNRVSDTHRTRRAFDVRTANIPEHTLQEFVEYFELRYGKFGAVASAKPQLIISKPHGNGPHLHIQLNRKYALPEINYGTTSGI
jgi:hypothetical protein